MSTLVEEMAALKAKGDYEAMVALVPYARWLGLSCEATDEGLLGKLAFSDMLVGNPTLPALHGGTLGSLLESTAIFQILWEEQSIVLPKTITVTVEYLRSAGPVDTIALARITKRGRRVINTWVEAWQEDRARPVATAHAAFLVVGTDEAPDTGPRP